MYVWWAGLFQQGLCIQICIWKPNWIDKKLITVLPSKRLLTYEALPGVLGNREKRAFISGEQRSNFEGNRGTKTILGNRDNIRKQIFRYLGNRGTIQFISGEQGNRYPLGGSHLCFNLGPVYFIIKSIRHFGLICSYINSHQHFSSKWDPKTPCWNPSGKPMCRSRIIFARPNWQKSSDVFWFFFSPQLIL